MIPDGCGTSIVKVHSHLNLVKERVYEKCLRCKRIEWRVFHSVEPPHWLARSAAVLERWCPELQRSMPMRSTEHIQKGEFDARNSKRTHKVLTSNLISRKEREKAPAKKGDFHAISPKEL